MSVLNKKTTIARLPHHRVAQRLTTSKNGNIQFTKVVPQQFFEALVATVYGRDTFYTKATTNLTRAKTLLQQLADQHGYLGLEYAARCIKFTRANMNMRTLPIVMTVELARVARGHNAKVEAEIERQKSHKLVDAEMVWELRGMNKLYNGLSTDTEVVSSTEAMFREAAPFFNSTRELVASVISRADELTDLYAYALTVFKEKGKVPAGIKRGVADAFNKFDAYQFGKYNRDGQVTFKRLLRIVHATPASDEQGAIFGKLMTDSLESPNTWEVRLSANGQAGAERLSDADLWAELATLRGSGEMGYMGLLRNLRNISQAGVSDEVLRTVANRISNPAEVAKSKQLPWNFIAAYEVMKQSNAPTLLVNAVADAIDLSLGNLPPLGDRVWVILDCSSSMQHFTESGLRDNEAKKPAELQNSPIKIGAIFAAALAKASKNASHFKLSMFSDRAEFVDLNTRDSMVTLYKTVMKKVYGGGTNLQGALNQYHSLGFKPDTVVVISDMEVNPLNSGGWGTLHVPEVLPELGDALKIAVNLNASESTPLNPRAGWMQLAGWSENIFKYADLTRNGDSIVTKLFNGDLGDYRG